jgi:hypothetical protein
MGRLAHAIVSRKRQRLTVTVFVKPLLQTVMANGQKKGPSEGPDLRFG